MSEAIRIRRSTLKLPSRTQTFSVGKTLNGYRIAGVLSIDKQKTVFRLDRNAVLCVRHSGYKLPVDLLNSLKQNTRGLVHVLQSGTLDGCFYTIDEALKPLPRFSTLDTDTKKRLVKEMADAVNQLHNLGYCHLDIKPEHFGLDRGGHIRMIDLDSARKYNGRLTNCAEIEYSPHYAAPEVFSQRFSTASDIFSLGVSIKELMNISRGANIMGWISVASKMCTENIDERFNYNQIIGQLNNRAEKTTGPRTFVRGKTVGSKTAYSDKQLALYLSESYRNAVAYCRSSGGTGSSEAAAVARAIHAADSTLPLFWYGEKLNSTTVIAREMSKNYPQKNSRMVELLRSGVLLDFQQIYSSDNELVRLLRQAQSAPDDKYWLVSQCFGGKRPVRRVKFAHKDYSRQRNELRELVKNKIRHGDPTLVASMLRSAEPSDSELEAALVRWRSVTDNDSENLTNIPNAAPFGSYIETRLPSPENGNYGESPTISSLFPQGTRYLISKSAFNQWKSTYNSLRENRRRRRGAVLKGLGWAGLGALILALLPYILAIAATLLIVGIILAILLSM